MLNYKLKEWNEICDYADNTCNILKEKGFDVRIKSYTLVSGEKGLYFQIFDNRGCYFAEYATGIHKYVFIMKDAIDKIEKRIVNEV